MPTKKPIDTKTIILGFVFINLLAADIYHTNVFYGIGQGIAAMLTASVFYGAFYLAFRRKKKLFSYSAVLIIANILLANGLLVNAIR